MDYSEVRSNACSGLRVAFYWVDNPSTDEDDHLDQAVDTLFEAIRHAGVRLWTPWNTPLLKAEFRNRLKKASRGELEPPDELKPVGDGRPSIYEIRWSEIEVHERPDGDGPHRFKKIEVRLLHGEPLELSLALLGLHAHEKRTDGTDEEIKRAQDAEIERAKAIYLEAAPRSWGVVRRTPG